jgi:hypothetical protein
MVGQPQRWLVCAALAGGRPLQLAAQARREESRGLVPWVGAAALLPQLPASAASSSAHRRPAGLAKEKEGSGSTMPLADDGPADAKAASGRAFVFLPLPIATGLPLHVNGCFELSRWEALADVFHMQLSLLSAIRHPGSRFQNDDNVGRPLLSTCTMAAAATGGSCGWARIWQVPVRAALPGTRRCCRTVWRPHTLRRCCGLLRWTA